jgi:hypothetical protein
MNLPAIASKEINNVYWKPSFDTEIANEKSVAFMKILSKKRKNDFLCRLKILPCQVLSTVIPKIFTR